MKDWWKLLFSEFLGTFLLVFFGASTFALTKNNGGSLMLSSLVFGLTLSVLIYTLGPYSGAHFNPAVSLGFVVSGQMNVLLMLAYWLFQVTGAILAGSLIVFIFGNNDGLFGNNNKGGSATGELTDSEPFKAMFLEALLTFVLTITYLFVYRNPMNAFLGGLIIGLSLAIVTATGGYLTGGSANPARYIGTNIFNDKLENAWIYLIGPIIGCVVAAITYKIFTHDFSCKLLRDHNGRLKKDKCGNLIYECSRDRINHCGSEIKEGSKTKQQMYRKQKEDFYFFQETPMTKIGKWLSKKGYDPRYIQQKIQDKKEKVLGDELEVESGKIIDKLV